MDLQSLQSANLTELVGQCHICNLKRTDVIQVSTYTEAMNVCTFCIAQYQIYLHYECGLPLSDEECEVCAKSHIDVIQVISSQSDDLMTVCQPCLTKFNKFQEIAVQSSKRQLHSLSEFCQYLSRFEGILCRAYIDHPDLLVSTYTLKVVNGYIQIRNDLTSSSLVYFKDCYEALEAESQYPIDSLVYTQAYKFLELEYIKYQKDPVHYFSHRPKLGEAKLLYWGKISASKLMQLKQDLDSESDCDEIML